MKKQNLILLSCCTALLLTLSLAACQGSITPAPESSVHTEPSENTVSEKDEVTSDERSEVTSGASADETTSTGIEPSTVVRPESSKREYSYVRPSEAESEPDISTLTREYKAALDALIPEYRDKIEEKALTTWIGKEKAELRIFEFRDNCDAYMKEVRDRLNSVTAFRSEGSLIGPKAPASYEDAVKYVRTEFEGRATDKTEFEALLISMKENGGAQNPTPYEESPKNAQRNFDNLRRYLWDKYGCSIENTPYFLTHP